MGQSTIVRMLIRLSRLLLNTRRLCFAISISRVSTLDGLRQTVQFSFEGCGILWSRRC
jgi:hypothetical protein